MNKFDEELQSTILSWSITTFGVILLVEIIIQTITEDVEWYIVMIITTLAWAFLFGINSILMRLVKRR